MRKALGMLTVRSIAFCATASKLHPSESQSADLSGGIAARRSSGPAPDRWSCRPWPPRRRRRRAASTTAPACSGSGSASGAMSRSYFAEFWTDKKGVKMDLNSFMYLDIEETDGTLYLSQIPSARSRSLKIIVIVNLVMLVVDIL